jgi:hypothetical protein
MVAATLLLATACSSSSVHRAPSTASSTSSAAVGSPVALPRIQSKLTDGHYVVVMADLVLAAGVKPERLDTSEAKRLIETALSHQSMASLRSSAGTEPLMRILATALEPRYPGLVARVLVVQMVLQ